MLTLFLIFTIYSHIYTDKYAYRIYTHTFRTHILTHAATHILIKKKPIVRIYLLAAIASCLLSPSPPPILFTKISHHCILGRRFRRSVASVAIQMPNMLLLPLTGRTVRAFRNAIAGAVGEWRTSNQRKMFNKMQKQKKIIKVKIKN